MCCAEIARLLLQMLDGSERNEFGTLRHSLEITGHHSLETKKLYECTRPANFPKASCAKSAITFFTRKVRCTKNLAKGHPYPCQSQGNPRLYTFKHRNLILASSDLEFNFLDGTFESLPIAIVHGSCCWHPAVRIRMACSSWRNASGVSCFKPGQIYNEGKYIEPPLARS
jgi:hypothetical protein